MQNRYPYNQWQEIIGNCDTQLFLGCTDEISAKFISDRSGDVTVGVSSEAKQLNSWRVSDYTPEYRETRSIGKRKLLTPDEILRLPLDNALIILRGQKVLKVEKYDYTLHPDAKKLIPSKSRDYLPKWRAQEEQETDYMPSIPKPKRNRRKEPAVPDVPVSRPDPLYTSDSLPLQEPDYDVVSSDFLEEPDMIPIGKDSIMS